MDRGSSDPSSRMISSASRVIGNNHKSTCSTSLPPSSSSSPVLSSSRFNTFPSRRRDFSESKDHILPVNWELRQESTSSSRFHSRKDTATATMSSTLAPPSHGHSAAKRYSNLFRGSRTSRMWGASSASTSSEDVSTPSFFDDLAFLEESTAPTKTNSFKASKNRLLPLRKSSKDKPKATPKPRGVKTHSSKPSLSTLAAQREGSTAQRTASLRRRPPSFASFPSLAEYDDQTIDLTDSIAEVESDDDEPQVPSSLPSSDSEAGGGGFFADLAFLEEQVVVTKSPKPKKPKKSKTTKGNHSPKSSSSSTFTTRFRNGSAANSILSRTSSLTSMSTGAFGYNSNPPPRRTSQTPSQNSGPTLPSSPPSLVTHSSSPSLSSTLLPSPSGPSRGSMQLHSKDLPALPADFAVPDGETPRAATFGHSYPHDRSSSSRSSSSPRPSAKYLFDSPSTQTPARLLDHAANKPLSSETSSPHTPGRAIGANSPTQMPSAISSPQLPTRTQRNGPLPPPMHSRHHSVIADATVPQEAAVPRPPRKSSLTAIRPTIPEVITIPDRLNRASLSAVLARQESQRSTRSNKSGTSPVSPTAEDMALLPIFNRLAVAPASTAPAPPVPTGLAPPGAWANRRPARMSVLSADSTSRCQSLIAAFPSPPEGFDAHDGDSQAYPHSLAHALTEMQNQVWHHISPAAESRAAPPVTRAALVPQIDTNVRPESDAFTFDDDYWLISPARKRASPDSAASATRSPHRTFVCLQRTNTQGETVNPAMSPTSPALLTPDMSDPVMLSTSPPREDESDLKFKEGPSNDSAFDLNSLIEHARPESATLPDYVSFDREGSLMSASEWSVHAPQSDDGSHYDEDENVQEVLTLDDRDDFSDCFEHDSVPEDVTAESVTGSTVWEDAEQLADESGQEQPPRPHTPTSEAARMDAFFALESLASSAGYRLVRASYMASPNGEQNGEYSDDGATTPTPGHGAL